MKEYDDALKKLKAGREGLEQFRAVVDRLARKVAENEEQVRKITSDLDSSMKQGNKEQAVKLMTMLESSRKELVGNKRKLDELEAAYKEHAAKMKKMTGGMGAYRDKAVEYDANRKIAGAMDAAGIGDSPLSDFSDLREAERLVQDKIDLNAAKVRVSQDLSEKKTAEAAPDKKMEEAAAEDLLTKMEIEMGLKTPETSAIKGKPVEMGPEKDEK